MKNKELFDGANAGGDKALQAKLRNNFAEWLEVVRCQDCKHCDISLVLPSGRKMYTCTCKEFPHCGAHLDNGERCDCTENRNGDNSPKENKSYEGAKNNDRN